MKFNMVVIVSFALGLVVGGLFFQVPQAEGVANLISVPQDRVREDQIEIREEEISISVPDAKWSTFADTHSMEPVLFKGANALQIEPETEEDIHVGDIISYVPKEGEKRVIIHRVIYTGVDEKGRYFIVKGDNNEVSDPERVRFDQIKRVLFAIIY